MFKKWFSYLIPINVFKENSALSKSLEVTWANGELVLDSANANYSYGSLQRILRFGLQKIGSDNIKSMQSILILGVAGGSVIKTLVTEFGFSNKIVGVEIDEKVIEIANNFFGLNKFQNLEIVINDAYAFVLTCQEKFDLIIIDIFEDDKMPEFLFKNDFVNSISNLVENNGFLIFNTMNLSINQRENFINCFDKNIFSIQKFSKVEKYNELFIVNKFCIE